MLSGIMLCVVATAILLASVGGAVAGQKERNLQATQTTVAEIDLQFQLGMADLEQARYALAAERFRWILERVPDYPGAAEGLAEAERLQSQAGTPQATLIPGSAENPDELFAEAQAFYDQQDWPNAIARLQQLQALDPRYREVEVKEMLYEALSTLGLAYIRGDRIEEGLVLLDQAEEIRPLDDLTEGERYLVTLYITGRSYWDLNWPIVIENFQAIYELAPEYRDVAQKLWEARVHYAGQLEALGAYCDAAAQYEAALDLREDSVIQEKYDQAAEACANPTPIPTATPLTALTRTPAPTPSPTSSGGIP